MNTDDVVNAVAKAEKKEAGGDALPSSVKSATRVLDLFECLGRWDAEKTHTEIAEELAIPKSSLTQLLKTLLKRGYLDYAPLSKGYRLGPSIAKLAKRENESGDIITAAGPILTWLANETQETCALNFLKGDKSEVVASVMGTHRLNITMREGDVAPLYATSGGKALLAHLPEPMLEEYLARVKFERITPHTITSVERLRKDLEQVKQHGFAYVYEEFTPGINGVAKAVLSPSGHALGALNVATPVPRFTDHQKALCEAALTRAVTTLRAKMQD
jgi:DNA-binding IclR family transcriptional regulator